jgi:fatty acid desaturase
MKDNPESDARGKRRSAGRTFALAAAILAVVQACLTIKGRGVEGFIAWVIILFVAYWLLFTFLRWLWGRLRDRG